MSSRPKPSAQPLRPVARYRRGQAPAGTEAQSDSSDEDQGAGDNEETEVEVQGDEQELDQSNERRTIAGAGRGDKIKTTMAVTLREVEVDAHGAVKVGGRSEVGRTEREQEDEESESESDEVGPPKAGSATGADSSSEYETDSEDELAPIYKPVFVSKRNRDTIAERDKEFDPDLIEERRLAEIEARKKISHDLVAESILRELALKDVQEVFPDVDDTDGLDEQAEFDEWKLRELMRIKRDKEAQYAREKEREEVEERRALPEGLRMKEDTERARKSREDKKKGSQVFMQKYHHKGAFYADSEILTKHDYTEPTNSTNRNMESLPAAMQVRNFGKMSQSKYTHLAAEDTTGVNNVKKSGTWGAGTLGVGGSGGATGGSGCFNCGGAHLKRDCTEGPSNGSRPPAPVRDAASRDAGWGSRPPPTGSSSFSSSRPRDGDGSARAPLPSGPSARDSDRNRSQYDDQRRTDDRPRYNDRDKDDSRNSDRQSRDGGEDRDRYSRDRRGGDGSGRGGERRTDERNSDRRRSRSRSRERGNADDKRRRVY